jgi:transcriptional regulator with XRE-family HTH domain
MLRWMRIRAGLTQARLADKLRVSRPFVSHVEQGKRGWANPGTVAKIVAGYCELKPLDFTSLLEVPAKVAAGGDAKDLVDAVYLESPNAYRAARGDRTIEDVADRYGVSRSTVGRFERCNLRELTGDKVLLLAAAYVSMYKEDEASRSLISPPTLEEGPDAHGSGAGEASPGRLAPPLGAADGGAQ